MSKIVWDDLGRCEDVANPASESDPGLSHRPFIVFILNLKFTESELIN